MGSKFLCNDLAGRRRHPPGMPQPAASITKGHDALSGPLSGPLSGAPIQD